jgi:hypothetical protein
MHPTKQTGDGNRKRLASDGENGQQWRDRKQVLRFAQDDKF